MPCLGPGLGNTGLRPSSTRAVSACLPTARQGYLERRKNHQRKGRAEEEEGAGGWAAAACPGPRGPDRAAQAHRPLPHRCLACADREVWYKSTISGVLYMGGRVPGDLERGTCQRK